MSLNVVWERDQPVPNPVFLFISNPAFLILNLHQKLSHGQCDQIAILFVQYLAKNSNENLLNGIAQLTKNAKIMPNTKKTFNVSKDF